MAFSKFDWCLYLYQKFESLEVTILYYLSLIKDLIMGNLVTTPICINRYNLVDNCIEKNCSHEKISFPVPAITFNNCVNFMFDCKRTDCICYQLKCCVNPRCHCSGYRDKDIVKFGLNVDENGLVVSSIDIIQYKKSGMKMSYNQLPNVPNIQIVPTAPNVVGTPPIRDHLYDQLIWYPIERHQRLDYIYRFGVRQPILGTTIANWFACWRQDHPVYRLTYPYLGDKKEYIEHNRFIGYKFSEIFEEFLKSDTDRSKELYLSFVTEDGGSYQIHRLTQTQFDQDGALGYFTMFGHPFKSCTVINFMKKLREEKMTTDPHQVKKAYLIDVSIYMEK